MVKEKLFEKIVKVQKIIDRMMADVLRLNCGYSLQSEKRLEESLFVMSIKVNWICIEQIN